MRTKEQYIQGLTKMKRNVYFNGNLIDRTDELQKAMPQYYWRHL